MSNYTLRLSVDQYELDASDAQYNPKEYVILQDFDYRDSKDIPVEIINQWRNVVIDRPERTILAVRIYSDYAISVRLNSGSEISNVTNLFLQGSINKIELKNTGDNDATVTVEMWS